MEDIEFLQHFGGMNPGERFYKMAPHLKPKDASVVVEIPDVPLVTANGNLIRGTYTIREVKPKYESLNTRCNYTDYYYDDCDGGVDEKEDGTAEFYISRES